MAYGQDELPELAMSVPLGASRLTRDWLQEDPAVGQKRQGTPPLHPGHAAARRAQFRDARPGEPGRRHVKHSVRSPASPGRRLAPPDPTSNGSCSRQTWGFGRSASPQWTWRSRLHLPGVFSEARAPQLLAGALVAEAALELFQFPSMEICPWALREGLILRRLDQLVFDGPLDPAPHVGQLADSPPAESRPAAAR